MSLVALYTGVLNAYGRFAIAAFTPTLLNVVLIAVLLAFIASGGTEQSAAAIALAWGITALGRCCRSWSWLPPPPRLA